MLPKIASGATTHAALDRSGDSLDLGKLLGETLSRLIADKRQGNGKPLLAPDDNGLITQDEFLTAVGALGLSPGEGRRIFEHFDRGRTGFLNFAALHSEVSYSRLSSLP